MSQKIKNIIIFLSIGLVLVLIYVFFIKKSGNPDTSASALVSSSSQGSQGLTNYDGSSQRGGGSMIGKDFLSLLSSVKSIKLDDAILTDPAFSTLRDGSIELTPDGTEGRPNPFAPIGTENTAPALLGGKPLTQ